jgi:hypothetical protein
VKQPSSAKRRFDAAARAFETCWANGWHADFTMWHHARFRRDGLSWRVAMALQSSRHGLESWVQVWRESPANAGMPRRTTFLRGLARTLRRRGYLGHRRDASVALFRRKHRGLASLRKDWDLLDRLARRGPVRGSGE